MGDNSDKVAVIWYSDAERIEEETDAEQFPNAGPALLKYAGLVRDVLVQLAGLPEFQHVEFLEDKSSYQAGDIDSPLCIVVGTPKKNAAGTLLGVAKVLQIFDVLGALTARTMLPAMFTGKVGLDEDGVLGFTDEEMADVAANLGERVGLEGRFSELVEEEEEAELAEALGTLVPDGIELLPLHPEDTLSILPAFFAEAVAKSPSLGSGAPDKLEDASQEEEEQGISQQGRRRGPGLGARIGGVWRAFARAGKGIVSEAQWRTRSLNSLIWKAEDFVTYAAKGSLRLAAHAVRPVLVGVVMNRALSTLDSSRGMEMRMARMSPARACDFYYRTLLGDDYSKKMEDCLKEAVDEVDQGLVTDDYNDEKRALTATMLRRLEVEEWDKERMKHFYYGSYGLGPWYFDMEERLHNPYFMGSRGWNGPIESWVGKNKVYKRDMRRDGYDAQLLKAIQDEYGVALTPSQKNHIKAQEKVSSSSVMQKPGGLLHDVFQ